MCHRPPSEVASPSHHYWLGHRSCLGCSSELNRMINLPCLGICVFAMGLPSSIAGVALPGLLLLLQTYLDGASLHRPKRILAGYMSINAEDLTSFDSGIARLDSLDISLCWAAARDAYSPITIVASYTWGLRPRQLLYSSY